MQPITSFRYYGRTQAARAAHPEVLVLTPDQEESVERWAEKRGSLGYPPKHKELVRMVKSMLNSDVEGKGYHILEDHYITHFLKRQPGVAATVARATDRNRVLAINKESLKTYFDNLGRAPAITRSYPRICEILMKKGSEWGRRKRKMGW